MKRGAHSSISRPERVHLSSGQVRLLPGSFLLYEKRNFHLLEECRHSNVSEPPRPLLPTLRKAYGDSSRDCSKIPVAEQR